MLLRCLLCLHVDTKPSARASKLATGCTDTTPPETGALPLNPETGALPLNTNSQLPPTPVVGSNKRRSSWHFSHGAATTAEQNISSLLARELQCLVSGKVGACKCTCTQGRAEIVVLMIWYDRLLAPRVARDRPQYHIYIISTYLAS
jgi:hypothetical protein